MRLVEFRPKGYRNLRQLPVVFTLAPQEQPDDSCSIRFLVGVNGTGKSNLLRFLAAIFEALDEGWGHSHPANPAYGTPFRLTYQLRGKTIMLESKGQGREGVTFLVDGERLAAGGLPGRDLILPKALMIFTSGDPQPWRSLLQPQVWTSGDEETELPEKVEREEEEAITAQGPTDVAEETVSQQDTELRTGPERMFLVEPAHLPLALLIALLRHSIRIKDEKGAGLDDVMSSVGVKRLVGFSLQLPDKPTDPTRMTEGLQRLRDALADAATVRLAENDSQLWVYDADDINRWADTSEALKNQLRLEPFQLFRGLTGLQEAGALAEVKLAVIRRDPSGDNKRDRALLTENLSDGELAFLERMALVQLLQEDECLFLLDEPEVHFNDRWKQELVSHIENALQGTNSEVILTTHASITLTDAYPEEIILLSHRGQERSPITFGAEQGEALRLAFGAERSAGRRAVRDVEEAIQHGTKEDLRLLLRRVGPGYLRFRIVEELERHVPSGE
jgi:predicted ATPase